MIDRVSVSQDDDGEWWLGFYADDIRYGVSLADILVWQNAAQQMLAPDTLTCVACGKTIENEEVYCFACYLE